MTEEAAQHDVPDPAENAARIRRRLEAGSEDALAELFQEYRERLRKIVRFRLDRRLAARLDESDVLQETYLRASTRVREFVEKPHLTPLIWFRLLLQQQLADLQRHHLNAEKRDARRDQAMDDIAGPATSRAIAAQLVASLTSPSQQFAREEQLARIEQSLSQMPDLDREIIALRHFEELSSGEAAAVLGIEANTASKRYVRAVRRLQQIMNELGGGS